MTSDEWLNFFEHPDVFAFCAKIAENPDDLAPKLVFADWLEENCPDERFVDTYRKAITSQKWNPHYFFERDGVGKYKALSKTWSSHTWLERVGQFEVLFRHDLHSMLRFCWSGMVYCATTSSMIASELQGIDPLYRLRVELSKQGFIINDAKFPNVRDLTIHATRFEQATNLGFLESAAFPNLRSLDLRENKLSAASIQGLFVNEVLARVDRLNLGWNHGVQHTGFLAIASSPFLRNLSDLDLSGNGTSIEQFREFLDSPNLPKLESLRLDRIYIHGQRNLEFWQLLSSHPATNRLKSLEVGTGQGSPTGLSTFFQSTCFQNLEHLCILDVSTESLLRFLDSPSFPNLKSLDLKDHNITDAGLIAMAKSPKMKQIQKLNLKFFWSHTMSGLNALIESEYLCAAVKQEIETEKFLKQSF